MNEMYLRFPNGRKKAFTISYDDNVTQDERLIKLMEQYKIKGTFNIIPGWFSQEGAEFPPDETYINVTEKKALELYHNEWVEVANHGFCHAKMTTLPNYVQMNDILKCREKLEAMYHTIITGFAYPYGWYDSDLMQVLGNAGITYARTVFSTGTFDLPDNWLELNPTCHHDDPKLSELTQCFLEDEVTEHPEMFYVWGHTFEFDRNDNWNVIETLFEQVSGKEDAVWYATNGELCDYHMAFKKLVCSVDGSQIYNPSGIDLWAEIDHVLIRLPAGSITDINRRTV